MVAQVGRHAETAPPELIALRGTFRGGAAGAVTGALVGTMMLPIIGTMVGAVYGVITGLVLGLVCGWTLAPLARVLHTPQSRRVAGAVVAGGWGAVAMGVAMGDIPGGVVGGATSGGGWGGGWLYPAFVSACALNGAVVAPACFRRS